jgi:hypothetical protein
MRDDLDNAEVHRGLAIVAVALLVSMASGFTLISSDLPTEREMHSFIGTMPEAGPNAESPPPTF